MANVQEQQKVNFEKFSHEANSYINKLSEDLGHPDEQSRVYMLLRSVLWTIRDRIHLGESFDLMAQFPLLLRGIYTDGWKFYDKPPLEYDTIEEMKDEVKKHQSQLGEQQFDWSQSTEDLVAAVINSLKDFVSQGQIDQVRNQMPKEVKDLVK